MLVNVRLDALKLYLTPQVSKLSKHGIQSVEQRVNNLSSLNSTISICDVGGAIEKAMKEAYSNCEVIYYSIDDYLNESEISKLAKEYSSKEFLFSDFTLNHVSDDEL